MTTDQWFFVGSGAVSLLTLGVGIYAIVMMRQLRNLRAQLGPEHQPENLEDILNAMVSKIKNLEQLHQDTDGDLTETTTQTGLAIKKVGLVRFNSFADEGGNLSFALALLDSHNSGIVLTNMHGRQQNRMYAKLVRESVGEVALNEEEQNAVMGAVQIHKNQTQKNPSN